METERRLSPQSGLMYAACSGSPPAGAKQLAGSSPPDAATGGIHISPQEITQMFEKKFRFQQPADASRAWQLPPADTLFGEYYQLEPLQQLRARLNDVKCKLNDYVIEEWSAHTRRKDPASEIPWRLKNETNAEFVTVAWCKFYECLHKYPLVAGPQLNSLHLCEAPGAFIAALNHYLHSSYDSEQVRWSWLSTTLNPYYEGNPLNKMIIDDRFMLHTLDHWLFHADFSGNIMSRTNIAHMQQQCSSRLSDCVQLITADGSIDCVEMPDCQEEYVASLHFAELTAALSILADGGCFVVKMFTLFEASSVSKLYLLNCVFEQVHVFKPATSKRGNSEVYVICLGFKKQTPHLSAILEVMRSKLDAGSLNSALPLFARAQLPADFLLQHEICARLFMNLQIQAIEANIWTYELKPRHDARRSHQLRSLVCQEFYKRYQVQPIPAHLTILYERQGQIQKGLKVCVYKGSHSEREMLKASGNNAAEQIFMLRSSLNELERSMRATEETHCGVLLNAHAAMDNATQPPPPLKLYRGAPIEQLHSSLFAAVHILLLRLKLQQVFASDPMWQQTPSCVLSSDGQADVEIQMECSHMAHDFSHTQRQFLERVVHGILQLQPQSVVFHNLPLLTHLSVSVLRYLSLHVFPQLEIAAEPTFAITLRLATCSEAAYARAECRTALHALHNLLQQDASVLCVLDIVHLHRNDFAQALTQYNNLLLLHNFKLMLNN